LVNGLFKQSQNLATEITLFLMAEAVSCAMSRQEAPDDYYNLERMLKRFATGVRLLLCGTCMEAAN
jgi:uncharacterized protein involved in oxidation of intracellular sulfur